jgi:transcriptional regulator with XRE-family HTH domain
MDSVDRKPVENLYAEVGRRLREARASAGMTQADVARATGVSRTSITNIEAGRQHLPLHQFVLIADTLDVSAGELLPRSKDDALPIAMRRRLKEGFDDSSVRTLISRAWRTAQAEHEEDGTA